MYSKEQTVLGLLLERELTKLEELADIKLSRQMHSPVPWVE